MPAVLRDKYLWLLLGAVLCARILAMLVAALLSRVGWLGHIYVDVWTWGEFFRHSQSQLIPYVDFSKEYPVGAGLLYWGLSRLLPAQYSSHQLLFGHAAFMAVGDVIN